MVGSTRRYALGDRAREPSGRNLEQVVHEARRRRDTISSANNLVSRENRKLSCGESKESIRNVLFLLILLVNLYFQSLSLSICDRSPPSFQSLSPLHLQWRDLVKRTGSNQTLQLDISNAFGTGTTGNTTTTIAVALVTHASVAKLPQLLAQIQYWNGPVSVAIYIHRELHLDTLVQFVNSHAAQLTSTSIHVLLEYSSNNQLPPYPHNRLRNLALDYSPHDLIVTTDVDLIPGPPNAHDTMVCALQANRSHIFHELTTDWAKHLYVLPPFDVFAIPPKTSATPDQLPQSKQQVLSMVQANLGEPIRQRRFPPGHRATNYSEWYKTPGLANKLCQYTEQEPPIPLYYEIVYEEKFEPYVLAYRPGLPRFWNSFRGYGYDKQSWFLELDRAGYSFRTWTQHYLVHLDHVSTQNRTELELNLPRRRVFVDYLNKRYPPRTNTTGQVET